MRLFCKVLIITTLLVLFASCHRHEPEGVVKSFYGAYQNLDFEKAKDYCTPYMSQRINLIQSGMNDGKKAFLQHKIKKQHIAVEEVNYNDAGTQAVVKVVFTAPDDSLTHVDYVTLEKCGDEWKVSNF